MSPTAMAGTTQLAFGGFQAGAAWAGAWRATDLGAAATDACGASLICASRSAIVGRFARLGLKHRRTMSTYAGARGAGNETTPDRRSGHVGRCWVSASTMSIPTPQMSPAPEILPSRASGGSYTEGLAVIAVGCTAGRMVSLASCS